ncbi:MAG TPA: hypothetical protein PL123_04240 [Bacteroidales bacterium]|nr:hypothetical protein [Bacteroidales bacterium]
MIRILGIKIVDRIKESGLTQGILSSHSSAITTRLGFHEVTDDICSREAYLILHLNCSDDEYNKIEHELEQLGGIEVRKMIFSNSAKDLNKTGKDSAPEIMGILLEKSQPVVQSVQKLLTSYGCNIRTRLGVNEQFYGEPAGLIILELKGDAEQRLLLEKDLRAIDRIHVRTMAF